LGDIWLFKQRGDAFNDLEIRLVQQVANHCAIAIRQARLFQASLTQVEELERLDQLKNDFLSTVSHELRTPMSNIKMAMEMLGITLGQGRAISPEQALPEAQQTEAQQSRVNRYFQILHDECDREIGLLNDLLDVQELRP
jgi:signal transduction histidine kinase